MTLYIYRNLISFLVLTGTFHLTGLSQCNEDNINLLVNKITSLKEQPKWETLQVIDEFKKLLKEAKKCNTNYSIELSKESYREIALLYSEIGNPNRSIKYFEKYLFFLDSLGTEDNLNKAVANYGLGTEYLKTGNEAFLSKMENSFYCFFNVENLEVNQRLVFYEVLLVLIKYNSVNDLVIEQKELLYNQILKEQANQFNIYKALVKRYLVDEKINKNMSSYTNILKESEEAITFLEVIKSTDFGKREIALNYRNILIANQKKVKFSDSSITEKTIKGIEYLKSIKNKTNADSIKILEFALMYDNIEDIQSNFKVKSDALEYFPNKILINADYRSCINYLTDILWYHSISLKDNDKLYDLSTGFSSWIDKIETLIDNKELSSFKREFSKFRNIHYHSLAVNEINYEVPDSNLIIKYCRYIINSNVERDSILIRPLGEAYIMYGAFNSNIDSIEVYIDQGIKLLNNLKDEVSKEAILEGLYIKALNQLEKGIIEIEDFEKIKTMFYSLQKTTTYQKKTYYNVLYLFLEKLIRTGYYKNLDPYFKEIIYESDIDNQRILLKYIHDLTESTSNVKELVKYKFECATRFEELSFLIEDVDQRERMLSRVFHNMQTPIGTKHERTNLNDSLYLKKAIYHLENINNKNKQDSVYLLKYYFSLRFNTCQEQDFSCEIKCLNRNLSYCNYKYLFIDTSLTLSFLNVISNKIQTLNRLNKKLEADSLYQDFSLLKTKIYNEGINVNSEFWSRKITIVDKAVNPEKAYLTSQIPLLSINDSISFLGNKLELTNQLGLAVESSNIRNKLIDLYSRLRDYSYGDSTHISALYSDLYTITNNSNHCIKSIDWRPVKEGTIGLIYHQFNTLMFVCFNQNNIDSLHHYKILMDDWTAQNGYLDHIEYLSEVIVYHGHINEIDSVILKSKSTIDNCIKRGFVLREEQSIFSSYISALFISSRFSDIINLYSKVHINNDNNLYYDDLYQKAFDLTYAYLFTNLDSSIHYYQEMISADLANDYNFRANKEEFISIIGALNNIAHKKNNDLDIVHYYKGDTLKINESIQYTKSEISEPYNIMGSLDCLISIHTIEDTCVAFIYNDKKQEDLIMFEWDKRSLKNQEQLQEKWFLIEEKISKYKNLYITTNGDFDFVNFSTFFSQDFDVDVNRKYNILRIKNPEVLDTYLNIPPLPKQSININIELVGSPNFSSQNSNLNQTFGDSNFRASDTGEVDWLSLPFTSVEIDSIYELLSDNNFSVKKTTSYEAEEKYVRSISNPDILHIATHGFIDSLGTESKYGVVLANANDSGLPVSNDGYLYASDIAMMNLDSTRLVVVSACESALYKDKDDLNIVDALFEAGVDHQLVTLWKIDDEATMDLMTSFYNNLAQTRDIRYSYELAQNFMREKYKDPYYWGSFILLSQDLNYSF